MIDNRQTAVLNNRKQTNNHLRPKKKDASICLSFEKNGIQFCTIYGWQVKPAQIVDKIIGFWLDLTVPGRGAGESSW